MNRIHLAAAARSVTLAFGTCMALGAQAAVLSSQPANQSGFTLISSTTLQNAETFRLSAAATVSGFGWFGTANDGSGFTVRLYTGNPDTGAGISLGGVVTRGNKAFSTPAPDPLDIFEFELTLTTAFTAVANQTYSVAIFSTGNDWGWQEGSGGDGQSFYRDGEGQDWRQDKPDLSLSVLGTRTTPSVPEPTSLALVGLALAAAAALRRRTA